jgi:hypothetical protein
VSPSPVCTKRSSPQNPGGDAVKVLAQNAELRCNRRARPRCGAMAAGCPDRSAIPP